MSYEYAVVPAPKKGLKAKGVKSNEDRFAYALQTIMNEYGAEGWEYVRTDTLPSEERSGFSKRTTIYQNMMVFRKPTVSAVAAPAPAAVALQTPPAAPTPHPVAAPQPVAAPAPQVAPAPAPRAAPNPMMNAASRPLAADPSRSEPKLTSE